jgi:hypothetical protein
VDRDKALTLRSRSRATHHAVAARWTRDRGGPRPVERERRFNSANGSREASIARRVEHSQQGATYHAHVVIDDSSEKLVNSSTLVATISSPPETGRCRLRSRARRARRWSSTCRAAARRSSARRSRRRTIELFGKQSIRGHAGRPRHLQARRRSQDRADVDRSVRFRRSPEDESVRSPLGARVARRGSPRARAREPRVSVRRESLRRVAPATRGSLACGDVRRPRGARRGASRSAFRHRRASRRARCRDRGGWLRSSRARCRGARPGARAL